MSNPQILYPSQPPIPAAPSVSTTSGGTQPVRTYYVSVTYVTLQGESLSSPETVAAVLANSLLVVTSPATPNYLDAPSFPTQYNVYIATASGAERLQTATPIALGTNWQEPTSGLIPGQLAPTGWGTLLKLSLPPRMLPYGEGEAERSDAISASGLVQTIFLWSSEYASFEMQWLARGQEAAAWQDFLKTAIKGTPFDYYPDADAPQYSTYFSTEKAYKQPYKSVGRYNTSVRWRFLRSDSRPVPAAQGTPTWGTEIPVLSPAPGNFTVVHGLGAVPAGALVQMTSGGEIWFQAGLYDATNVLLRASEANLTARVMLWSGSPVQYVAQAPPAWSELLPITAPGGAAGNFSLAHGLGRTPFGCAIMMTSAGEIYFQSTRYDPTNLFLVASDANLTAQAAIW